jgi:hypothetical protein
VPGTLVALVGRSSVVDSAVGGAGASGRARAGAALFGSGRVARLATVDSPTRPMMAITRSNPRSSPVPDRRGGG